MSEDAEHLICCRCGQRKPAEEFAWRRRKRGQRDTFCRPCRSAYGKEHYEANKQRYIDQARAQKQRLALERTSYLIEYFASNPCVDCGETDPLVLEFDHLRDKRFNIGNALPYRNWRASSLRSRSAPSSARTAIAGGRLAESDPSARC